MSKRIFVSLVALAFGIGGMIAPVKAQQPGDSNVKYGPNERAAPGAPVTRPIAARSAARLNAEVLGTITYDDGVVNAVPSAGVSGYSVGNWFNTATGAPVLASGTVTQMTFFMVTGAGTDSVFISLYGAPSGTTAPFVDDQSVPLNNGSGAFNTAPFAPPNVYPGASFLAGVWYVAGDTVGLGDGTVNGQGWHAMAINDITGTDFQTIQALNALLSATGNVLIPVELMGFSVDD